MLQVKWTIVDTIHLKGVKSKASVDSQLNDSPGEKCDGWRGKDRRRWVASQKLSDV